MHWMTYEKTVGPKRTVWTFGEPLKHPKHGTMKQNLMLHLLEPLDLPAKDHVVVAAVAHPALPTPSLNPNCLNLNHPPVAPHAAEACPSPHVLHLLPHHHLIYLPKWTNISTRATTLD
jgi:hypothetical protein